MIAISFTPSASYIIITVVSSAWAMNCCKFPYHQERENIPKNSEIGSRKPNSKRSFIDLVENFPVLARQSIQQYAEET